jgi:hypothetical protein
VAEAHLLEHLQVVQGPLLQALALDELADRLQLLEALAELVADGVDRLARACFGVT